MTVELRGMIDPILPGIVAEVNALPIPPTHLVAATDDLFALTLLGDGGIDHLLRRLVAYGMDPVLALRCATYNAAYRLQRADLGARRRRPPRRHRRCSTDLETFTAEHVLDRRPPGRVARPHARRHRGGPERPPVRHDAPRSARRRRHAVAARRARRRAPHPRDRRCGDDALGRDRRRPCATAWSSCRPVTSCRSPCTATAASTPIPHAALLSGWGDWTGAVATTVAHDTHNLVVFGRDPRRHGARREHRDRVGRRCRGGARRRGARAHRAADRGHPLAAARAPRSPTRSARCRTPRSGSGSFATRSLTQPLFQVMLSSLACLPGPHVTDVGLIDGTTGGVVATALIS